ncbi:MAG: 3-dehydroquinate synthase [Chloroflexi bacterium RBG_16_50_9]|nr:MAG: 3-dehydroquinate synthase [Chloroflexi bacterium RBG_16_50_9]
MEKIKVELGSNRYEIRVGAGLLLKAGPWLKEMAISGKVVIITDTNVKGLYGDALSESLTGSGLNVTTLVVSPGEEQKSLDNAGKLYHELVGSYAERTTPILALGGGVIGDLAGFVAATYMRGVPLIQVPTTLLAQVDSSIGGKTAVDHGQLKNVIGVFYQPKLVISDIDTLKTLTEDELSNGLAEVIKSAAIRDGKLFRFLENNLEKVKSLDTTVLEGVVFQTARVKATIVAQDEKETGLRAILNYGHTIGHALETTSNFQLKHGQAVAMGMVAAARISHKMGILDKSDAIRLEKIIKQAGLSAEMLDLNIQDIIQAMKHDKKVQQNKMRFVLLKSIGDAFITDEVSPSLVEEVLSGQG